MTDRVVRKGPGRVPDDDAILFEDLAGTVLPALVARLRASHLAELEVRSDGWRVRLRRDPRIAMRSPQGADPAGTVASARLEQTLDAGAVRSPAVGYFSPARGLIVGSSVAAGDRLGGVDMLGIVLDVVAPIVGLVTAIEAEPGQAVEYGQVLVEIDPLDDNAAGDRDEVEAGVVDLTPGAELPT
jgi:biotin carboxyl carrier protein